MKLQATCGNIIDYFENHFDSFVGKLMDNMMITNLLYDNFYKLPQNKKLSRNHPVIIAATFGFNKMRHVFPTEQFATKANQA